MANKAGQLGLMLQSARESKGLSLTEVETETKIRQHYLRGLEEENYAIIPSAVQIRGFLRNYAGFLGLDADEIIGLYNSTHNPIKEPPGLQVVGMPVRPLRTYIPYLKMGSALLGLVAIILAIGFRPAGFDNSVLAMFGQSATTTPSTPSPNIQTATVTALNPVVIFTPTSIPLNTQGVYATATPLPTPTATPIVLNGLVLKLTFNDACWLNVLQDSKPIFTDIIPGNTTRTFTATNSLKITFGKAAVVSSNFNGKPETPLKGQNGTVTGSYEWTKEGRKP